LAGTLLRLTVAVATVSLIASPVAFGAVAGGFNVRPAHVDPTNPATRAYFIENLAPGQVGRDTVIVDVAGSQSVDLWAYPVDGLTGVTSGDVYSNRTDPLRRAGRWISRPLTEIHVPAHSQRAISFEVRVPATAAPGDHLAGLALENAHPQRSPGRFSVTGVIRAVIGMEIEAPGPASQQIKLRRMALVALPGTQVPSVVVTLGDAGRKLCKPHLSVSLSGNGSALTVQRQLDTVLPGDYIPFPLPWPRALAAGSYRATATASGCGRQATLHSVLHLARGLNGSPSTPDPKHASSGGFPWWLLILVAAGGVLGGLALSRFRDRRAGVADASG